MKTKKFLLLFCLIVIFAPSTLFAFEVVDLVDKSVETPGGATRLRTYEIPLGESFPVHITDPQNCLFSSGQIASVIEKNQKQIVIRGEQRGETMLLVWTPSGIETLRIKITPPKAITKKIEESKKKSSRLYQSQKRRSFKFFYESRYNLNRTGREFSSLKQNEKVYDHLAGVTGGTPFGTVKGQFLYEYRRERSMTKSVMMPRDAWFGLFDTQLPLVKGYNLIFGEQYRILNRFGFTGARYNGITFEPGAARRQNPKRGQLNTTFLIGAQRDGGMFDNPASFRNREIKDKLSAQRLEYNLWRNGKIALGAYERWDKPSLGNQSNLNFNFEYDFQFKNFKFYGEAGIDDGKKTAVFSSASYRNDWLFTGLEWIDVAKKYKTVTGTPTNQSKQGFATRFRISPFQPLFSYEKFILEAEYEIYKDKLAMDPERPNTYLQNFYSRISWDLPWEFRWEMLFQSINQKGAVFPYTKKYLRNHLRKEFTFESGWIKRISPFVVSTFERYRDAVDQPGFNSDRSEVGGGIYVGFPYGLWTRGQYLWNRLHEREPTPPLSTTHPAQWIIEGGLSHSFQKIPLNIGLNTRYTNVRNTFNKTHQPFSQEDRFESSFNISLRLPMKGRFYINGTMRDTTSRIGKPDTAEFWLQSGVKLMWDTNFYIPEKGVVEGYLFRDENANGVRDPGEPGLEGYEITSSKGKKTKTHKDGHYRLKLTEGVVQVRAPLDIPGGYFYTTPNEREFELLGKQRKEADFGISSQIQLKGHAFIDINKNKVFDSGDVGFPGVQIRLGSGALGVTSKKGQYSIINVKPGDNTAQVVLDSIPMGYLTTTPIEKDFFAKAGEVVQFDVALSANRMIGGVVFRDLNGNGILDSDEPVIAEATITMDGKSYKANRKGRYYIHEVTPGEKELICLEGGQPQKVMVPTGPFSNSKVNFPISDD